jgi:hypothetical protein
MAPLLRELLADYAATGVPPAYLSAAEPAAAPTTITSNESDPA